ncbi:SsrA-binding protein, partial [candidate division WWE3 bacterium]|nr:SsrA-binding protein [candidate division WWE3 bacterium]
MPTLRKNRDVLHKYSLFDKYEAGIELYGWEVKAIKSGNIDFKGSYVKPLQNELYWINAKVAPLGELKEDYVIDRSRKLLLHREEVNKLLHISNAKSMAIVPVRLYTTRNLIKLEIATAKGKKKFEQSLAQKRKS